MHLRLLLFGFLLLGSLSLNAQNNGVEFQGGVAYGDTVKVKKSEGKYYNPKVAARRSAIIPGWGQIYNDSWWKVPLLYGGFGLAIHFIGVNEKLHQEFLDRYEAELLEDAPNQNRLRIYSRNADTSRRNRDMVILTMVGIYALQIIDATVDAHLKGFNVDDNLSLNLKPKFGAISDGTPFVGMKLTLPIGR